MSAMLILTALLALQLVSTPTPTPDDVVLVRTRMGPLSVVTPGTSAVPLGPRSPPGFGLTTGRLRHLATSEPLGLVIVEVAGPTPTASDPAAVTGGIFALSPANPAPVMLASTRGVDLDVALSPDGRRLLYIEGDVPMVVTLTAIPSAVTAPLLIAPARPMPANVPEIRIERPRWLDNETIAYERSVIQRNNGLTQTTIEVAPADGSANANYLVPRGPAQDRLAAVVGEHVLAYRGGTLHLFSPGKRAQPIGLRFAAGVVAPFPNLEPRLDLTVLALGPSGVTRSISLATLDAAAAQRPLAPARTAYLDPIISADRAALYWSVATPAGFVVERIDLATRLTTTIATSHPTPIELVRFTPDRTHLIGCRGPDLVVIDTRGSNTAPRVLTSAPDNPSCAIRGVTTTHVAFDQKLGDDWQLTLVPFSAAPIERLAPGTTLVATLGDRFITQAGWEGVGTIVREPSSDARTHVTLVPWQDAGISDVRRTPGGATVLFRIGSAPRWQAVRVDRPGVLVDVTGPAEGCLPVGLDDDRLVAWDATGRRFVSWRLDGRDSGRPTLVLGDVLVPGPYAANSARVIAIRGDGTLVSARSDGSDRDQPTRVIDGATRATGDLLYDATHRRVVASTNHDGRLAIVAADLLGADRDHPKLLGHPRPPQSCGLDRLALTSTGDVVLVYATMTTAMPHPAGSDTLAADGSGFIAGANPSMPSALALGLDRLLHSDDGYGAETRTPIR